METITHLAEGILFLAIITIIKLTTLYIERCWVKKIRKKYENTVIITEYYTILGLDSIVGLMVFTGSLIALFIPKVNTDKVLVSFCILGIIIGLSIVYHECRKNSVFIFTDGYVYIHNFFYLIPARKYLPSELEWQITRKRGDKREIKVYYNLYHYGKRIAMAYVNGIKNHIDIHLYLKEHLQKHVSPKKKEAV